MISSFSDVGGLDLSALCACHRQIGYFYNLPVVKALPINTDIERTRANVAPKEGDDPVLMAWVAYVGYLLLKTLRLKVRASLVRVSCLHAAFPPESASREFGTVLCRSVPAFAFLRIEYLALFAHVVGFTHVASES